MEAIRDIQKGRVYRLFAAMNADERKSFIQFSRRYSKPKRQRLLAGFRYLISSKDDPTEANELSQSWWQAVFPGLPFDRNQFRKHQNKLMVAMSDFLVERHWHKEAKEAKDYPSEVHAAERQLLLLNVLWDHGLDNLFISHAQKMGAMIAALREDQHKFGLGYKLALQLISHAQKTVPFQPIAHFSEAQAALDHYYVINTLQLEIANRSQQRRHQAQPDLNRLPLAMALMDCMTTQSRLAQLSIRLLDLTPTTPFAITENVREEIVDAQPKLAPDAWKDLLYLCLNFAIGRVNNGDDVFRLTVLRIYLTLLQSELLQRDKVTFKHNFLNIMNLAFFRDPPEAFARYAYEQKSVLENHSEYKNAVLFFECQQIFAKKEYETASNGFMKIWFLEGGRNVRYAAGIFLIKCYFELDKIDDLRQFSTDFKRIVSNDKGVDVSKKEAYRQFLKAIQVLCNLKFHGLKGDKKNKLKLLEDRVSCEELMISKDWLLHQIQKLWERKN